tara:strand:- start:131 stop:421 length:291 start_codon:yes stop_codon:yes gene_type:complete
MFSVNVGASLGDISVATSEEGGLSSDQLAEMARRKIIYVSQDAPPAVREQAQVFSERVEQVVKHYVDLARGEERATICQILRNAGHKDIAEYVRRL